MTRACVPCSLAALYLACYSFLSGVAILLPSIRSADTLSLPPQNVYVVALGTIVGHSCCTALAVIGGRYVSTKISVKHGTSKLTVPAPCSFHVKC